MWSGFSVFCFRLTPRSDFLSSETRALTWTLSRYLYSRIPFFGRDLLKFCTYCFLKLELLILFLTEELQVDILCLQREAAETKIASLLGVSTLGLSSLRTDLLAVRSQVNIPRFLRTFGIKIDPNISVGSRSRVIERTCWACWVRWPARWSRASASWRSTRVYSYSSRWVWKSRHSGANRISFLHISFHWSTWIVPDCIYFPKCASWLLNE